MRNGIRVFATESARRNQKPKQKKPKKADCPSCEIKMDKLQKIDELSRDKISKLDNILNENIGV